MKLKKVFSTIAAAALAVSGMAMGASAAFADDAADISSTTITLTASNKAQLEGHTFSAIKLADYASDGQGYVSVTTAPSDQNVYNKIVAAAKASNGGEDLPANIDPIAYISGVSTLSALTDDDQTLGEDNSTSTKPWTGEVRTFVNDLTDDDTLKNVATAVELGAIAESGNGYSADLNMGAAGLYLIFDTTVGQNASTAAIPMLVGTAIRNASNKFVDENGDETTKWPATYMGKVAIKNETTSVTKSVDATTSKVGDTVHYTVKAPLPTTTGFSAANPYDFTLTDTPGVGQNVTIDTNKNAADATFKVFVDVDGNGEYNDGDVLLPRIGSNSTDANGYKLKYTNGGGVTAPSDFVGSGEVGFIVDLANFVSSEDYQNGGYAGKNIVVKYQATITANAPSSGVVNDVKVNARSAVADDHTTVTLKTDGKFSFTKTDAEGADLTGAKFVLKDAEGNYYKQDGTKAASKEDAERGGDVEKTQTAGENVAAEATASATFTPSWNNVAALNDGDVPDTITGTAEDQKKVWGSNSNVSDSETVTYTFAQQQTLASMKVKLWQDGSGVFLPKSLEVSDANGAAVNNLTVSDITDADWVTLTFDPVATNAINLKLVKQNNDRNGVAISEWQVYTAGSETSKETARFSYTGLADGTYTVEETQAPEGYLDSVLVKFNVTIKDGVAVYFDQTDLSNDTNDKGAADGTEGITDYSVKNFKTVQQVISQLPLTGGAGIAMFTIVGLLLVGAGAAVYVKNRNGNRALRV